MLSVRRILFLILAIVAFSGVPSIQTLTTAQVRIDASSTASVSDEKVLQRLIEQDYVAAWTKQSGQPFSMNIVNRLYLQSEELTAFDTDLMALNNPPTPTRIKGWRTYREIWPRAFQAIDSFRNLRVENLGISVHGERALTTFDAPGELVLSNGDARKTFKNFTLVWTKRNGQWHILHEHISDGRGVS